MIIENKFNLSLIFRHLEQKVSSESDLKISIQTA